MVCEPDDKRLDEEATTTVYRRTREDGRDARLACARALASFGSDFNPGGGPTACGGDPLHGGARLGVSHAAVKRDIQDEPSNVAANRLNERQGLGRTSRDLSAHASGNGAEEQRQSEE